MDLYFSLRERMSQMHVSVLRVSAMGLQNLYIFNYQNITGIESSYIVYATKQRHNISQIYHSN